MTARQHHYLSQCYLKGFTTGQAKNSKLSVIDLKEKKAFETIPRNVGGFRDFNRMDIEGIDKNQLETELSKFENKAATALKNLRETLEFSEDEKDLILNLMALIAVRSPERRERNRLFHAQVVEKVMSMVHHSKESWEREVAKLKTDKPTYSSDVTYEEAKEFFEGKRYTIEVARERQINIEMHQVNAILPCLFNRNWLLVTANDNTGPFITTDCPVNLTWKDPEKVPSFYRASPGFGMKDTEVYFPISQSLALIGEFDGREGTIEGSERLISVLNTKMLSCFHKQIYSPKLDFKFFGENNQILSGKAFIREAFT